MLRRRRISRLLLLAVSMLFLRSCKMVRQTYDDRCCIDIPQALRVGRFREIDRRRQHTVDECHKNFDFEPVVVGLALLACTHVPMCLGPWPFRSPHVAATSGEVPNSTRAPLSSSSPVPLQLVTCAHRCKCSIPRRIRLFGTEIL